MILPQIVAAVDRGTVITRDHAVKTLAKLAAQERFAHPPCRCSLSTAIAHRPGEPATDVRGELTPPSRSRRTLPRCAPSWRRVCLN